MPIIQVTPDDEKRNELFRLAAVMQGWASRILYTLYTGHFKLTGTDVFSATKDDLEDVCNILSRVCKRLREVEE